MLHYNLTIERQLPFDMGLTLGFAGSRGINLLASSTVNARIPTVQSDGRFFWAGNEPRPNPAWTGVTLFTSSADSWYNSLQFVLQKRLTRGLQFQSSYTWGKLLDVRNGFTRPDTAGSNYVRTSELPASLDKGPGESQVDHTWRFNAIYRLPQAPDMSGVRGALVNGWWVSGILTAQTGDFFSVGVSGADRSRSLGAGNTPDLVPGRWGSNITSGTTKGCAGVTAGQKLGTPELYFDPCAFTLEPQGYLGTTGRNILSAPGTANLDFSLVKDTKLGVLGESGNLQFRVETFNILNRVNFGRPNATVFSSASPIPLSTAGDITRTSTASRQLQFALKVTW
jgi:hypothetical protein